MRKLISNWIRLSYTLRKYMKLAFNYLYFYLFCIMMTKIQKKHSLWESDNHTIVISVNNLSNNLKLGQKGCTYFNWFSCPTFKSYSQCALNFIKFKGPFLTATYSRYYSEKKHWNVHNNSITYELNEKKCTLSNLNGNERRYEIIYFFYHVVVVHVCIRKNLGARI